MKNTIYITKNGRNSCVAFNDQWLMISNKVMHTDINELEHCVYSFHKSGTNGYHKIDLPAITSVEYKDNYPEFKVYYINIKKRIEKYYISIRDDESRRGFCDVLAVKCGLNSKTEQQFRFSGALSNIVYITGILILTFAFHYFASGGNAYHRRASVHLVREILQFFNPTFVLIAGFGIAGYFIFKLVKSYVDPSLLIKYTKR